MPKVVFKWSSSALAMEILLPEWGYPIHQRIDDEYPNFWMV
jgi:hypothetical protein